jgi:hypothetical protein
MELITGAEVVREEAKNVNPRNKRGKDVRRQRSKLSVKLMKTPRNVRKKRRTQGSQQIHTCLVIYLELLSNDESDHNKRKGSKYSSIPHGEFPHATENIHS